MSDKLLALSLEYFYEFSSKNIEALEWMFNTCASLQDWEISAVGKTAVLAANQKIFDSVDSIIVCPKSLRVSGNTVTAELLIQTVVKGKESRIKVCDIIEFDSTGKILSVTAYKG